MAILMANYWNAWHPIITHWMISMTNLMTCSWTACHHIMTIEWVHWLSDDQLLKNMTAYSDHWMSSMWKFMASYWNAWQHKMTDWMSSMTNLTTRYWTMCHLIMSLEWVQWQTRWPVTEWHDIIYWPLNEFNNNLYGQLLKCMTSYKNHWMSSMTISMTSYWIAWHHIMTIEWVQWQSLWPVTGMHDII